jgi:hypothetical protein
MQIVISAICTSGTSLRNAIAMDGKREKLEAFQMRLDKMQVPGRQPGWLKLRGTDTTRGAINIVWDRQSNLLTARVVTRGSAQPSAIVGDFVNYLLARHGQRVRAITTAMVR